jgi:hypothetical protein
MVDHLTTLLDRAGVVPAVNQIEVHPYFVQPEVQALGAPVDATDGRPPGGERRDVVDRLSGSGSPVEAIG